MLALVVAPDAFLAQTLAFALQAMIDGEAVTAQSAAEAQALLVRCRPELVLGIGWLPTGDLVTLMAQAGRLRPRPLRIVLEARRENCAELDTLGVDLVLEEGEPPARLVEALAQLLPARAGGGGVRGSRISAPGWLTDPRTSRRGAGPCSSASRSALRLT